MRLRWLVVLSGALLALAGVVGAVPASAALPSVGLAPVLSTPVMSGSSVKLSWIDRSTHEDSFAVIRRWSDGQLQNVGDSVSADKAGTGGVVTFVDTAPNSVPGGVGLLCYQVWAYDFDALFDASMSQNFCVNGALDPYDSQTYASLPKTAAPSVDSVQLAGAQVTVKWTDRATDEDGFRVYRRDTSVPNWLANHNPANGDLVSSPLTTSKTGVGKSYTFVDTLPTGTTSHRWCYSVAGYNTNTTGNPSSEKCIKALPAVSAPAPGPGTISTPALAADPARTSGVTSSVAIGTDGLPLISYYSGGSSDLVVAHCDDALCASATTTHLDTPGDVGRFTSIKIGADGLGIIAYTSKLSPDNRTITEDLKVAHCEDVACTSATITTLDSFSTVDARPSVAIAGDGLPTIAYQDDTGHQSAGSVTKIKVTHCRNQACTSASTSSTIDTVPPNGGSGAGQPGGVSMAASPTGLLYLSYLSGQQALKMATCFDPSCQNVLSYVAEQAPAGYAGWFPSLAIGRDGLPLVSYFRNGGLSVAHCVNISCSGITVTTVDVNVGISLGGEDVSLAIGADGFGVISYFGHINLNLKVAHCTDLVCGAATVTTVDEFDDTGRQTAITIGADGLPVISYLATSEATMKVAHCPNVTCTGEFTVPFLTGGR